MQSILGLIDTLVALYMWAMIFSAILSWLVAFNVVNTSNPVIYRIGDFLHRITEPVLGPIRRMLPNLGGIDISPIIVILLIQFIIRGLILRETLGYRSF
ncbi:MAG: YggT family protein [Alphaproteobacteria bacterium]|jgi:YggT family protein